jgi:hypothetical protein
MIEKRPPLFYFFLFLPALAVWALHSPVRWFGALGVLFVLGLAYLLPWTLRPRPMTFFGGVLFSFLFAYFVIYADSAEIFVMIYSQRQFQALSLSILAMIVLQWYSWRSSRFDWLFFSIGLFFLFSTVFTGLQTFKLPYIWLTLSFIGAFLLSRLPLSSHFSSPSKSLLRNKKYIFHIFFAFALFMILATNIIAIAEWVDESFSKKFSDFIMRQQTGWSGFSGTTHLQGNSEIQLSERIALLVDSPRPLDYLKGNILTVYHKGLWTPLDYMTNPLPFYGALPQNKNKEFKDLNIVIPGNDYRPKEQGYWAKIQLKDHFNGILFLPHNAALAAVAKHAPVYQNQYALLRQERQQLELEYWAWVEQGFSPTVTIGTEILTENLGIPTDIRSVFKPLAEKITQGAVSPREKATLIEKWFKSNFLYSLQTQTVPAHMDPTVDFVLNRRPAFCSWFASGMVLMLRSIDIPAHIVSGWRGMEHIPLSQTWVVREKQAHDWVEIYDSDLKNWVSFDPTPGQQLDSLLQKTDIFNWLQHQSDSLRLFISIWKEKLNPGFEWQELLSSAQNKALYLLKNPIFYLILVIFGILNAFLKRWKTRAIQSVKLTAELAYLPLESRLAQLSQIFYQRLADADIKIEAHQTFTEIAPLLENLSPQLQAEFNQIQSQLNQLRFGSFSESEKDQLRLELAKQISAFEPKQTPVQKYEPGSVQEKGKGS